MTGIAVSIIVPVYKAEKYLKKCLDTLVHQTATNYEVLLIDDGSPDNSGKICDSYADKYPRVRVFHQENQGVTRTRETAIKKARGDYIIWVDADDYADENLVAKVVEKFMQTGADLVAYGTRDIEGGVLTKTHLPQEEDLTVMQEKAIMGRYSTLWNFSVSRTMWIDKHAPSEMARSAADGYMAIQMFLEARKIAVIEEPLYYHLIDNPTSIRHTFNGKRYMGNFYLWYYRLMICRKHFPHHIEHCASRAFSGAVKAYSMAVLLHDLSSKHTNELIEAIRTLWSYPIEGRWRDKFLGWCILHNMDIFCVFYARHKISKMKK